VCCECSAHGVVRYGAGTLYGVMSGSRVDYGLELIPLKLVECLKRYGVQLKFLKPQNVPMNSIEI
jgi:hypothetical protein